MTKDKNIQVNTQNTEVESVGDITTDEIASVGKKLGNISADVPFQSDRVVVGKNESLEKALKRFKKQSSGVISEIKKREAYDKPSVKRKKKSKEARKKIKKKSNFR